MNESLDSLETKLGHTFADRDLLTTALTHPSYRYENTVVEEDNQRLEFLGDAVLGLVAADYMFRHFPSMPEGILTRYRSQFSSRQALTQVALGIQLGAHLRLGRGEELSGGRQRESNLADALEAVLGAAFLDEGLSAADQIFKTLFVPCFESDLRDESAHNPKGQLQEIIQKRTRTGPQYQIVTEEGPPHSKVFTAEVLVQGEVLGRGTGSTKQLAEMQAAREAINALPESCDI